MLSWILSHGTACKETVLHRSEAILGIEINSILLYYRDVSIAADQSVCWTSTAWGTNTDLLCSITPACVLANCEKSWGETVGIYAWSLCAADVFCKSFLWDMNVLMPYSIDCCLQVKVPRTCLSSRTNPLHCWAYWDQDQFVDQISQHMLIEGLAQWQSIWFQQHDFVCWNGIQKVVGSIPTILLDPTCAVDHCMELKLFVSESCALCSSRSLPVSNFWNVHHTSLRLLCTHTSMVWSIGVWFQCVFFSGKPSLLHTQLLRLLLGPEIIAKPSQSPNIHDWCLFRRSRKSLSGLNSPKYNMWWDADWFYIPFICQVKFRYIPKLTPVHPLLALSATYSSWSRDSRWSDCEEHICCPRKQYFLFPIETDM